MVDDSQRQEIGAPPPVAELVPELADADLIASCDLRKTCRTEIDALVRLYDKRYAKRRDDFLKYRRGNKPLSEKEISKFHRQWREYVRGVVEPLFARARRAVRLHAFVREQEQALECKLVDGVEARKIVPVLDLKLLAQKGRLRRVKFEKVELYYAEEDLKRIAIEDAEIIEKRRQKDEAEQRQKARAREENTMKRRLRTDLYELGIEYDRAERIAEEVASFPSVRDLFETEHFSRSWNLTFPQDCVAYLEKEIRAAEKSMENVIPLRRPKTDPERHGPDDCP